MQGEVGVYDPDACHRGQIEAARNQLCAHQDVRAALAKRLPDLEVRVGPTRRVAVQPQHTSPRPQLLDHTLQPLRAHAKGADLAAPAVVACGGHGAGGAAAGTDQTPYFSVLDKRGRAAPALHRPPAIPAHDESGPAPPVEIEDGLLPAVER